MIEQTLINRNGEASNESHTLPKIKMKFKKRTGQEWTEGCQVVKVSNAVFAASATQDSDQQTAGMTTDPFYSFLLVSK